MENVQDASQQDTPIVDGEIVSSDSAAQTNNDQATILTSLDELIKSHIATIDRLQEEQKKLREMVADGCNNDATFKELSDKAKEAAKAKGQARQQIMNQPAVLEVANKLKDIVSELKEKQVSLSDYLLEYQRMAGVNQIEGYDGEVREIIHIAKLAKKSSKKRD